MVYRARERRVFIWSRCYSLQDISVHLEGFEVPHIMDYLSRKILQKADTKFLFREPGRQSRQKPIREHFAHKGVIHKEDANDVHEFCSLYKRWMRTLAEPLIPIEVQKMLVRRILSVGPDIRSYHLQAMAELLVSGGLNLSLVCLIHCVFFLQQIVLLHHENAMNADALAGIFAIVLFKEEVDEYASRDFQTWEPILSGLSLFLEYLFTGLANSVLEEALDHSELNKKRSKRNKPGHISVVRANTAPHQQRPRPRNVSLDDEPVLQGFRSTAFDSTSTAEDHQTLL